MYFSPELIFGCEEDWQPLLSISQHTTDSHVTHGKSLNTTSWRTSAISRGKDCNSHSGRIENRTLHGSESDDVDELFALDDNMSDTLEEDEEDSEEDNWFLPTEIGILSLADAQKHVARFISTTMPSLYNEFQVRCLAYWCVLPS